jgi:hypothetical protein
LASAYFYLRRESPAFASDSLTIAVRHIPVSNRMIEASVDFKDLISKKDAG